MGQSSSNLVSFGGNVISKFEAKNFLKLFQQLIPQSKRTLKRFETKDSSKRHL
jgi:hypothetical protein